MPSLWFSLSKKGIYWERPHFFPSLFRQLYPATQREGRLRERKVNEPCWLWLLRGWLTSRDGRGLTRVLTRAFPATSAIAAEFVRRSQLSSSRPGQAVRSDQGRRHGPSITTLILTSWVILLQPARRASPCWAIYRIRRQQIKLDFFYFYSRGRHLTTSTFHTSKLQFHKVHVFTLEKLFLKQTRLISCRRDYKMP